MKYVVIDTRDGGDFSLDLLFAGLVKTVGAQNVFDWPKKRKHREWDPDKADWGMERRTHGYTKDNHLVWSIGGESFGSFDDVVVFTDEREESLIVYERSPFRNCPIVIVAGHDRFWNSSPEDVAARLDGKLLMMFLDDWQDAYDCLPFARLTNLSINYDHFWDRPKTVEKKYDIFFYGYNSHPDRARFIDHIESHPVWSKLNNCIMLERTAGTMQSFIRKREYFRLMAESRMCLNLRGASQNGRALRLYEIPYVGSCMVHQRVLAKQLDPFINGVHCAKFSDEHGLDIVIDAMLGNDEERETIAVRGHDHAMRYHTAEARMEYILREIGHR